MAKEDTQVKPVSMNVVKFSALLILALVIVVYSILLFTGSFGKPAASSQKITASKEEIVAAKKQIEGLLSAQFVKGHSETNNVLTIRIDTELWKKLSIKERKAYVMDLGTQKAITEVSPVVKIADLRTGTEYASYEYNRVTLAELGF
ncbi:hypothetical protein [Candidatus Magnetominusculus dajiuhuensis]|uniref:hypothetical protein n=1 Tax=Candidatus Magnetominusculus dajiuhuensis TaxID=3137712 RepID=UPI003B4387C9